MKHAHGRKQYKRCIQAEYHEIGECVSLEGGLPEGSYFNVTRVARPDDTRGHDYLPAAYRSIRRIKAEFDLNLTTVVIGHTHHARIAVYESGGEFFALMDCGAWIENYRTRAEPESRPNAQIGAMVGNDCRIYQIV